MLAAGASSLLRTARPRTSPAGLSCYFPPIPGDASLGGREGPGARVEGRGPSHAPRLSRPSLGR
jgi:hypothetical protein